MGPAERIVIVGGPGTGKTTLSHQLSAHVQAGLISADDSIGMEWSAASQHLANIMGATPAPWIAEGVRMAHALRKCRDNRPDTKPCERVYVLSTVYRPIPDGSYRMARGAETVFNEIRQWLLDHGVKIDDPAWVPPVVVPIGVCTVCGIDTPIGRTCRVRTCLGDGIGPLQRVAPEPAEDADAGPEDEF